jgi:hypothetical protein
MGAVEIPAQGNEVIKIPNGTYEFGANFLDPKVVTLTVAVLIKSWFTSCDVQVPYS